MFKKLEYSVAIIIDDCEVTAPYLSLGIIYTKLTRTVLFVL